MKILKETLFERIRNRLAPDHAVKIIARLQRTSFRKEMCYGAVKEASELLERYRVEARLSIRSLRMWESSEAMRAAMQPTRDAYGRMLAQQARAATSLYLDARRDYLDLVSLSIARCQGKPAND